MNQALYNLFAAYLHFVPLSELIESVERALRDAQYKYIVIYGRRIATTSAGLNVSTGRICGRLHVS
jgi:hypothetical protein